ncbi:DivIVA domain-containing protein [Angustibacter speluncae]
MARSQDKFARVSRAARGYRVDEVDAFFARARVAYERGTRVGALAALTAEDVRTVAFRLRWGGYDVQAVDSALDRLEDAVAARERGRLVRVGGEDALFDDLARRASSLQGRLDRPAGDRFAAPRRRFERGYRPDDVDALCDRLDSYFNDGEEMSADEVRRAVFRPARGRRAYREPEVDAFLDKAVDIMVTVD